MRAWWILFGALVTPTYRVGFVPMFVVASKSRRYMSTFALPARSAHSRLVGRSAGPPVAASRELYPTESVDGASMAKQRIPLWIAPVTSSCTTCPCATGLARGNELTPLIGYQRLPAIVAGGRRAGGTRWGRIRRLSLYPTYRH